MQIPSPHQAEDGATSESCTFYVGGLSATHRDILSNGASWKKTICSEVLGLRCGLDVPHFSLSPEQTNAGVNMGMQGVKDQKNIWGTAWGFTFLPFNW